MAVVILLSLLLFSVIGYNDASSCNMGLHGCRCPDSPRVVYCHSIGLSRVPRVPFMLDTLSLRWNFIDSLYDVDIDGLRVDTLILSNQQTGSCVRNRLTKGTSIRIIGLCNEVCVTDNLTE